MKRYTLSLYLFGYYLSEITADENAMLNCFLITHSQLFLQHRKLY